LTAHLEGAFTPVGKGAEATLSIYAADVMIYSVNLASVPETETTDEGSAATFAPGRFSIDLEVRPDLIRRITGLTAYVDSAPDGIPCKSSSAPFRLQMDPDLSYYETTRGTTGLPSFDRFPQVLMPTFPIGFDRLTADRVDLACGLIVALQRATAAALVPSAVSLDDLLNGSGTGVIVAPASPKLEAAVPLLAGKRLTASARDRVKRLKIDSNLPAAVLEATQLDGRNFLSLSWTDGRQPEKNEGGRLLAGQIVATLAAPTANFRSLSGDTYLLSPGSPPLSISLNGRDLQATPLRIAPNYLARLMPIALVALGIGAVLVALGVLRYWLRRRRRKGSGGGSGAESS
jgi:hypothetical protein